MGVYPDEQLVLRQQFPPPLIEINSLGFGQALGSEAGHAFEIETVRTGYPTERRFVRISPTVTAVHDPFEHAHVFAVAGPEVFTLFVLAEPVHVKDAWDELDTLSHGEPMAKVVAHVITAEGKHGHWVAAKLPDGNRSNVERRGSKAGRGLGLAFDSRLSTLGER